MDTELLKSLTTETEFTEHLLILLTADTELLELLNNYVNNIPVMSLLLLKSILS